MLLYATTTSERASKGQGGNKYIHLAITDEAKQVIYERITLPHPEGYLVIEPREQCAMVQKRHGGGYHYPFATAMTVFEEIKKGNQQKGDICNFNACQNTAVYYGVCDKHRFLEQ